MPQYLISPRHETDFAAFFVRARDHEHAASIAVRRLFNRRASAWRVTGTATMSGVFQGYVPARTGGLTSIGGNFHVQER